MKELFIRVRGYILAHRLISAVVAAALFVIVVYASGGGNETATTYIPGRVTRGTLEKSVSGTGQIVASTQIDLKAKAAGDVVYIGAKAGDEVAEGKLLVQFDASDAQKAVRDAKANLESAQLSLRKLLQPATELQLLQAENDLDQAKETLQNAQSDLDRSYEEGFNTVSNAFLDLPSVMTGLESILYDNTINSVQDNIAAYQNAVDKYVSNIEDMKNGVDQAYKTARTSYDATFTLYDSLNRFSDPEQIVVLVDETYKTTQLIAEAVKTTKNYIDFVEDVLIQKDLGVFSQTAGHQSSLDTFTSSANNHLINLLNIKNTIESDKETITNSERTIDEQEISLRDLKAGADAIDVESQQLTVTQRENALRDANEKLADYYLRAPINGVVASLDVFRGESVSSGAVLGTIITKQQVAEITLNEIDVASLKPGQKAVLSFDALEDLEIKGEVIEVDTIGSVSQGVVSYGVKIGFDGTGANIKPGMSVSASVTTDTKENVLLVPNSAIKIDGTRSYVEVLPGANVPAASARATTSSSTADFGARRANFQNMSEEERQAMREQFQSGGTGTFPRAGSGGGSQSGVTGTPEQRYIETGLSNDLYTEVISGLEEGDVVVVGTATASTAGATTQPTNSILPTGGRRLNGGR